MRLDSLLYKSMVNIDIEKVFKRLKIINPHTKVLKANSTVIPNILPPNKYAYTGNTINLFTINAIPVAITQEIDKVMITVLRLRLNL